ncbi:hypothetical protein EV714DRAFT_217264 [Schizophyllum commune]
MASTSSQAPVYDPSVVEEHFNEAPSLPPERRAPRMSSPRVARARAKQGLIPSTSRTASRTFSTTTTRSFSTTPPRENAYPFPTNPRPTPHQIFHLPVTATQKEIKARYYDLVRLHHPDSHNCRHMTPAERHRRFQAITNAYDILRGKKAPEGPFDPFAAELARRKRAYAAARRCVFPLPFAPVQYLRHLTEAANSPCTATTGTTRPAATSVGRTGLSSPLAFW